MGWRTARHIRRGDEARGHGNWPAAARHYRAALERHPSLQHIWIQLGHALKEAGDRTGAADAYCGAAALRASDLEPLLRLGHMLRDGGELHAAADSFVRALERAPGHLEASAELANLLPEREDHPDLWHRALAVLGIDPAEALAAVSPVLDRDVLLLEATDLFAYFGRARLPTGIQRVQIELLLAALNRTTGPSIHVVVYSSARRGWILLAADRVRSLCCSSLVSDDGADAVWQEELRGIYTCIAIGSPIRGATACTLINLGTTWSDPRHRADVQRLRAAGMRYIAHVHDLIPVLHPEWFVPSLTRDYLSWMAELPRIADGFIAISDSTRADLLAVTAAAGAAVDPARVRVVRDDGDFRRYAASLPAEPTLSAFGLKAGEFVLMVSTVEPRKNHVGAFRAWLLLIEQLGEAQVPLLVCVGGKGWLNDEVHAMLAVHPALQRSVRMMSGVADDALTVLYRYCRFTLYPSFYEGWGLPVSESLSYGKVPAVSRTSSLPEAGGSFAAYFNPANPHDIARTVAPLITDGERRAELERAIVEEYRARTWGQIAAQMIDEAVSIGQAGAGPAISASEQA